MFSPPHIACFPRQARGVNVGDVLLDVAYVVPDVIPRGQSL